MKWIILISLSAFFNENDEILLQKMMKLVNFLKTLWVKICYNWVCHLFLGLVTKKGVI